ncbi:MAG: TetR family transcriptional regulator C-terminal domain-containing protein [Reichenbachiella sp.]|uniref:TetR family transcriptional regulator C-terminal domain-containing protein n=1 Tax=Reichenbachiella sp. TaxID=2184521 RepID=UPI003299DCF8
MATKEKNKSKSAPKSSFSKSDLISAYMDKILDSEKKPESIYKFCKESNIEENQFYEYFGSFEALQKGIWDEFINQALSVISKSKEYRSFNKREKLLTFYYTFFEILTLNRSYILLTLKGPLDLSQLSILRHTFQEYISGLAELKTDDEEQIKHYSSKAVEELAWAQMLVILRFWIKDDSTRFEKTDVMIEKTINTTFDVVDTTPIKSVVDYAKFLFKETVNQ